jgi:energy-coupling factor transporter ATP-binding protein EcfA2
MLIASREIPGGEWKLTLNYVLAELVADGLVSEAQAKELGIGRTADPSLHPLVRIAAQEWQSAKAPHTPLTLERLTRWLSEKANLPYLRIDPLRIDVGAVTSVVKQAYATRFKILPVAVAGDRVTIATAEPYVREWERELSGMLKLRFDRVIANPLDLDRYLAEFYAVSRSIAGASSDSSVSPLSSVGNLEQLVELGRTGEPDANDQHIVRIVDWLLQYAFDQRASDIHLEPRRDTGNIRFRIDGVLHLVHQIPTPVLNAAISRLKALGRMDIIEKRRPQDGRIKTLTPERNEVELRLSTMPTTFGEKLVMRIFDPEVLVRSLTDLGFSPKEEKQWQSMVAQPYGMVVVTGPTGSGKTTTLYSALKRLSRPEVNICTIEDPIELVDPDLNQMYVQHQIDRGHRRAGGPHRTSRALYPAHERRAVDRDALPGARRPALSAQGGASRRRRPTFGTHAVPSLQAADGDLGGSVAIPGGPHAPAAARESIRPRRMRRVPAHGVHGAHRDLRGHAPQRRSAQDYHGRHRQPAHARRGARGRYAAPSHQRRAEGRRRPHHRRGSVHRRAGRGRGLIQGQYTYFHGVEF